MTGLQKTTCELGRKTEAVNINVDKKDIRYKIGALFNAQILGGVSMRAKGYLSVLVTSVLAAAFLFTAGGCAKETRRESEPTKPNAAADAPPPSESGVVTVKKQSSYDILQKDPHGILVAKTTVTNTEVCVGGNLYLQTVVVPAGTLTVTPTGRMCKE